MKRVKCPRRAIFEEYFLTLRKSMNSCSRELDIVLKKREKKAEKKIQ